MANKWNNHQTINYEIYFDESSMLKKIANTVVELRRINNLTQLDLARKIGTTQSVVARLETDDSRFPKLEFLNRIANAFNMKLSIKFENQKRVS